MWATVTTFNFTIQDYFENSWVYSLNTIYSSCPYLNTASMYQKLFEKLQLFYLHYLPHGILFILNITRLCLHAVAAVTSCGYVTSISPTSHAQTHNGRSANNIAVLVVFTTILIWILSISFLQFSTQKRNGICMKTLDLWIRSVLCLRVDAVSVRVRKRDTSLISVYEN